MNTHLIASAFVSVNILSATPGFALAEWPHDPQPTDEQCYRMIGIALFKEGHIRAIDTDENGFRILVNNEKFKALSPLAKEAMKVCFQKLSNPGPPEDPENWPYSEEEEL